MRSKGRSRVAPLRPPPRREADRRGPARPAKRPGGREGRSRRCAVATGKHEMFGTDPAQHLLLQKVLDSLPDAVFVKDAASRYVIGNGAHARLLGLESDAQVRGRTIFDFFPPEQAEQFYADDRRVLETGQPLLGGRSGSPRPAAKAGGSPRPRSRCTTTPVGSSGCWPSPATSPNASRRRWNCGRPTPHCGGARRSCSGRWGSCARRTGTSRRHSSRSRRSRKCSRSAGWRRAWRHEVKNPLSVPVDGAGVPGAVRRRRRAGGRPGPAEALAVRGMMRDALERAESVIHGLLDFSAPSRLDLQPRDLNAVVERSLSLVSHELIVRRVEVVRDLAPGLPPARLDAAPPVRSSSTSSPTPPRPWPAAAPSPSALAPPGTTPPGTTPPGTSRLPRRRPGGGGIGRRRTRRRRPGGGHGARHSRSDSLPSVRTLLHHQAGRRGFGAGAFGDQDPGRTPRREHLDRQPPRRRNLPTVTFITA